MISLIKKYKEIITYLVFGVMTTAVNFIVYSLCVGALSIEMTASNAIAWVVAVAFAFVTNKLFVFGSRTRSVSGVAYEAFTFVGARLLSGVLEVFCPTMLVFIGLDAQLFGVDGFVAKVVVSVVVIILNYVFSKLIVFRKKK